MRPALSAKHKDRNKLLRKIRFDKQRKEIENKNAQSVAFPILKYKEQLLGIDNNPKFVVLKRFTSINTLDSKNLLMYFQKCIPTESNIVVQSCNKQKKNDKLRLHFQLRDREESFKNNFGKMIDNISESLNILLTSCFNPGLAQNMSFLFSKAGCQRFS
jgi:hypothetical protein